MDALYYRGSVYEKLACLDEAIADFSAVLRLDPNHIKASYARGACRNLKGEFSQAIGEVNHLVHHMVYSDDLQQQEQGMGLHSNVSLSGRADERSDTFGPVEQATAVLKARAEVIAAASKST